MGDEVHLANRRARGDDLRAADDEAVIAFFLNVDKYVGDFVRRTVSIDRRMDYRMIPVQNLFLRLAIPAPGIVLKGSVEVGIGGERSQEGRLVVRAASHPPQR